MDHRAALSGSLAAGAALAAGELAAGIARGIPSPVDAIAQEVIGLLPGGVTRWAIDVFGGANRAVLAAGTLLIVLVLGAASGVATRRSFAVPAVAFVAAGALGVAASAQQPGAAVPLVVVGVGAAVATGLLTLRFLLTRTPPAAARRARIPSPTDPPVGRRAFLVGAGGVAAAALVTTAVGRQVLAGGRQVDATVAALPRPVRALPPVGPEQRFGVDGLSPLLTPNDRFYRIDTAFIVPRVDPAGWSLRVHGLVDREVELSYDDLLALPLEEVDITLACVSNEVGGDLVGTARWLGVPLGAILDRAGVQRGTGQVVGRAVDGWTAGFPVDVAADGRRAIVAVGMNGEPLPPRHGYPARLVVPGLYGYVSATKWLADIELTTWEGFDAYWVPRGWAKEGPMKTASRIDVPRAHARVAPGGTTVAGVAWAPTRGVAGVEVRADDGPWLPAELTTPLSADTWVQWRLTVPLAEPGTHRLTVRATDGDGHLQSPGPRQPFPDGAEGWHTVQVRVG